MKPGARRLPRQRSETDLAKRLSADPYRVKNAPTSILAHQRDARHADDTTADDDADAGVGHIATDQSALDTVQLLAARSPDEIPT